MNKLATLLIVLFVFLILGMGSIAGFTLFSSTDASAYTRDCSKSPEDYAENNVYYLINPTLTSTLHYLRGVSMTSDGTNPDLNKIDLENGKPVYFTWPRMGQRKAVLEYNQSFSGDPYICMVVNSKDRADKVVNVEIGLDKEDDNNFEVVCTFPPYHTTGDNNDGTMEEEYFEAYGTWQGGTTPPSLYEGWIKLKVTMTSGNGDPCLLYCGFDNKLSWCSIPYKHTDLLPRAQINSSFIDQGFDEYGRDKLSVGDKIWFDGRDSYDPNDDYNGNRRIDDGDPAGEQKIEQDKLLYKWNFGDGSSTSWDYMNRNMSHVYSTKSMPKGSLQYYFQVNLTVRDAEGHTAWNRTYVKIYRGNHSPEIISFTINNVDQINDPKTVKTPLDGSVSVYFNAYAIDQDEDEIEYHWDFNGDLSNWEEEGPEVVRNFHEDEYKTGLLQITLEVSDDTPVKNATALGYIKLVNNKRPVSKISAWRKGIDTLDTKFYENLTVRPDQEIVFDASDSYDPDNLTGFDINNVHHPLQYRWNFDSVSISGATSDWITNKQYEYAYSTAGTEYKYIVTLDVDDGLSISTSENFTVFVNVRPIAKIAIKPESYNSQGNFEKNNPIYFNGSGSYDSNGDKIKSFIWDFGDGNKSYEEKPVHTYTTPSEYIVSLVVIEDNAFSMESLPDQFIVDIPQPPAAPIPRYKVYPLQIYTHKEVRFDATGTTDPDSDYKNLKFKWEFGDNTTSSEDNITHRYLKQGEYLITLQITDETGVKTIKSEIVVHVLNRKPVAKIRQLKNVQEGENVRLSGADSRDDDGYITQYLWDFGDGSESDWENDTTIEHKWKHAGRYTITLSVMDDEGQANKTQMQLRIQEPDTGPGGFSGETVNSIIAGAIITVIIIIVAIVVIIVIRRSQESI